MNPIVRNYLIELARSPKQYVFYSELVKQCGLGFDLNTPQGREKLKETLIAVSSFEHHPNRRPLLSSLAINKKGRSHGPGFYTLAEELGFGKAKKLQSTSWGFMELNRCREFWQDPTNYRQFKDIAPTDAENLFTIDELNHFKQWQNVAYIKQNPLHVAAKDRLMDTVWTKTIELAKEIASHLEGFVSEGKKTWNARGWTEAEDTNKHATVVRHYTWAKVFKKIHADTGVFFTVGIDARPEIEAFVYKIDFKTERDATLSDQQISIGQSLISPDAKWNAIPFDTLISHSAKSLTEICVNFIHEQEQHYEALIAAIWQEREFVQRLPPNTLSLQEKPSTIPPPPKMVRQFRGADTDFIAQAIDDKTIGEAGESLVRMVEIKKLEKAKRNDLAKLVRIVKDGEGYDVCSFDILGNPLYIEVKTTKGNALTPFYLSENEYDFMKLNTGSYKIYRIYHFELFNNSGEYFILTGEIEKHLHLLPTQYQVYLK